MMKTSRNDPCPCGSGKRYKHCCSQNGAVAKPDANPLTDPVNKNLQSALEHHNAGRLPLAEAIYLEILQAAPDHPGALHLLGVLANQTGRNEAAIELIGKALTLKPDYAKGHCNLGTALKDHGRLDEAASSYRKALALNPDFAEAYNNLGTVLHDQGKLEDAVASYRKALALNPDYAEAYNNLGFALQMQNKLGDAIPNFNMAITLKQDYVDAYVNLGTALREQGKLEAAFEVFRKVLLLKPDYAEAYTNVLFFHAYHALLNPLAYLAEACGWEKACVPKHDLQKASSKIFQRSPLNGRRLKVGYVSGDFCQHAVSYFAEQLIIRHDKSRVELFAYSSHTKHDAVTERLQASAENWVSLVGIPDAAAVERISADNIDVLIDLSGHTAHNRLGIFARRAAPVQAHYLGFFASTGLTEMDYWIGDEILTPPETDSHFSEQVWRLPRVWVSYEGKPDAPLPAWQPAHDGTVWMGSFNNLGKLTPATLALWARVLHALPEGKLLLKTKELADAGNRRRILDGMANHGIAPDRIELQDRSATPDWSAHMAYYDRLDIALDPVGSVGGGTTTCDALWMGVPVITLEGDRMASRMTASMLDAIGHPEWIARSEAEYIDKVVALARDAERRKALRAIQRSQVAHSPLCDAKSLVLSLENAYFEMFKVWLEKQ